MERCSKTPSSGSENEVIPRWQPSSLGCISLYASFLFLFEHWKVSLLINISPEEYSKIAVIIDSKPVRTMLNTTMSKMIMWSGGVVAVGWRRDGDGMVAGW